MSLDHALLVSLLEKPSSGYELARRFDRSIGHFWHATHQQIYRVLGRMEASGWVDGEIHAGETAPDRKVFKVTADGRRALSAWLSEPTPTDGGRSTLMVKLRGAAFDTAPRLIPEIEHHLAQHRTMLASYQGISQRDFPDPPDLNNELPKALQQQVLRFGLAYEETWIRWCEDTLALLRQLESPATPPNHSIIKETP